MKSDDELERYLASALQEPAIEDHGFTRAIEVRLTSHRQIRRTVLACAAAVASAIAAILVSLSRGLLLVPPVLSVETVAAALLLAALCSLVWIGTEPTIRSMSTR